MVIEEDWLLDYNCEENPHVFKIVGVFHMAAMRSIAFLEWWEEVNKIGNEVILGEVQHNKSKKR